MLKELSTCDGGCVAHKANLLPDPLGSLPVPHPMSSRRDMAAQLYSHLKY